MDRRTASRFASWQWLASRVCVAALPLLAAACTENSPGASLLLPQPVFRSATPDAPPEKLPPPQSTKPSDPPVLPDHKVLSISLDIVFHLAEEQNLQVGQGRARVDEAEARLALTGCLHPVQKVNAERKLWQQRAELSKLTAETLLEAASTYVDLLAAQAGRAIVLQTEKDLIPLLERAQKLAATEPGAQAEVVRIRAEVEGSKQDARSFAVQAAAAAAKLVYLLALDPCTELLPVDCALVPYNLVDVRLTCCELVGMALNQGPGVQEMGQMVAVIDEALAKSHGLTRAGGRASGDESNDTTNKCLDWIGRLSSCLTNMFHRADRRRIALAEQAQAHLAYDDLKAKLAAGVQEAYETILGASEQIQHGTDRVKYAQESRKLSQDRLNDNVPGSSYSEVLLSLQGRALAQLKYVAAIRDYDKSQLRLMVLTGGSHGPAPVVSAHPLQEIKGPADH
jgi:outer membrane protein TolC